MKNISTNKLQNDLSKVIKSVEAGETYRVSRYSEPVAYLVSKEEYEKVVAGQSCRKCVDEIKTIIQKSKVN